MNEASSTTTSLGVPGGAVNEKDMGIEENTRNSRTILARVHTVDEHVLIKELANEFAERSDSCKERVSKTRNKFKGKRAESGTNHQEAGGEQR